MDSRSWKKILALFVLWLFPSGVESQLRSSSDWEFEPVSEFNLLTYVSPIAVRDAAALQDFVRDDRFYDLRGKYGDAAAIDAIFDEALYLSDNDVGHALLIAALGAMDHFSVSVVIPILGVITFPLTLESRAMYDRRYRNLPGTVLADSAGLRSNDRDKLQHFFGSAYIAFTSSSEAFADCVGNMVESGEESFIVGGRNDERDKLANRLGQQFGMRLLNGEDILPTDVLFPPSPLRPEVQLRKE